MGTRCQQGSDAAQIIGSRRQATGSRRSLVILARRRDGIEEWIRHRHVRGASHFHPVEIRHEAVVPVHRQDDSATRIHSDGNFKALADVHRAVNAFHVVQHRGVITVTKPEPTRSGEPCAIKRKVRRCLPIDLRHAVSLAVTPRVPVVHQRRGGRRRSPDLHSEHLRGRADRDDETKRGRKGCGQLHEVHIQYCINDRAYGKAGVTIR